MNVTYYINNSDNRKINKNLTNAGLSVTGELYGSSDILNPVLKVKQYTGNYLYIEEFQRFYFITDIMIDKGFYYIRCSVDVLYTYKDDINNSTQLIVRSEQKLNPYINDNSFPVSNDKKNIIRKFNGAGFPYASPAQSSNRCYVLGIKG